MSRTPKISLAILLLFLSLTGCKYYTYQENTGVKSFEEFNTTNWGDFEKKQTVILHTRNDTLELYDIIYIERDHALVGRVKPFSGFPRGYYLRMNDADRKLYQRPFWRHGDHTRQVHFFVDEVTLLDSNLYKIKLNEIGRADTMKQSVWNQFINAGAGAMALVGAIILYGLVSTGY